MRWLRTEKDDGALVAATAENAIPFSEPGDLAPLAARLAKSKVVFLGESSHGTHEFYEWRRSLSEELIRHHGFRFIAVEGDWPPCAKVNAFLHAQDDREPEEILRAFRRWPTWMWANAETGRLIEWMKAFNRRASSEEAVGFHGLDVYSLFESMGAMLRQLREVNPFLARQFKHRLECFDPFRHDERSYAKYLVRQPEGCREAVVKNLKDVLSQRLEFGWKSDALFDAQQNARIIANAEDYYRTMVHGSEDSWNVRDRHMLETLEHLLLHYGPDAKAIVWAHNTHIGDYRATDMLEQGQINLGGLAREKWGDEAVRLVGFGTYEGEVTASHAWDGPTLTLALPPARQGSYENAFRKAAAELATDSFYLDFRESAPAPFHDFRGHRAVGVVYRAEFEHLGNYVPTAMADRYDAFVFFSGSRALDPIPMGFERREIPETWPQGM